MSSPTSSIAPASAPPVAAASPTTRRARRRLGLRAPLPPTLARIVGLASVGVVLLLWWLLTLGATAESRIISPVVLPSPGEVLRAFPVLFTERGLVPSIAATLQRVVAGFLLAILVGVPLGILAGTWGPLRAAMAPIALFLRNIPIAVLIPLTVFWFGIDETQKVLFIFLASVPFVFGDAVAAVVAVPERFVETALTLGASARQVMMKVLIPLALPSIYDSLRNLFGLAFGYIMLAELINARHGLGYLINMSQRRGQSQDIFAILIIIGAIALLIDAGLRFFQRGFFPWRPSAE